MAALTADRNTPRREGQIFSVGVAAATKIFAGSMVAINAAGFAVPAANTAGLKVIGRAEAFVDNTAGANGALSVDIRDGIFKFVGAGLSDADIGKPAFVTDDQTIQTAASTNNICAGIIVDVDSATEPWILMGAEERAAGARADVATANAGGAYTANEQTLINELKTVVNDLLAKLRAARLIGS